MKVRILRKNGQSIVDLNRRKAIRERCLNCAGWYSKDIANCLFNGCSLYLFRSRQEKQNARARVKAIRKYCLWCCSGKTSEVAKCPSIDCPLWCFRKGRLDKADKTGSVPKNDHIEACLGAV